jgi:tRNA A37 N6-isopentenylltransferase MiaA
MKPELYKELGKRQFCREVMVRGYNRVIRLGEVPECWNATRTKLLKKIDEPQPKDHRPIAVANISYKILMSFIKKSVEEHLRKDGMGGTIK